MTTEGDKPVFDVAHELPQLFDLTGEWTPPRSTRLPGIPVFRCGSDGPSPAFRIDSGVAYYSSNRFRGQAANDNHDWPLAKLLRSEGNDYLLGIAQRYRDIHDAANAPHDLVGRDLADNIYIMADLREDESTGHLVNKGPKKVTGRKAKVDEPGRRAVAADPDKTKKRSKPIPKKWNGDWPLLHHIDATWELAAVQATLGWLREAFEAAVVGGETLEAVGRKHGVGNKAGAKGAGRALVYLGLQCVDEFWRKPMHRAA